MRKFLIAAALVAVAACGEKAAETPADTTTVAPAATMDTTMKMDSTTVKPDSTMPAPKVP
jgi:hypothetical protein